MVFSTFSFQLRVICSNQLARGFFLLLQWPFRHFDLDIGVSLSGIRNKSGRRTLLAHVVVEAGWGASPRIKQRHVYAQACVPLLQDIFNRRFWLIRWNLLTRCWTTFCISSHTTTWLCWCAWAFLAAALYACVITILAIKLLIIWQSWAEISIMETLPRHYSILASQVVLVIAWLLFLLLLLLQHLLLEA